MIEYYFSLSMSYQQCMDYYYGKYTSVQIVEDGGRTVRFSAKYLRPFVSSIGIRGRFRLLLTSENQFIRLEKVT